MPSSLPRTRRIPAGTTETIDGPLYAFRVVATAAGASVRANVGESSELLALQRFECPRDASKQRPWDQLTFTASPLTDLVLQLSTDAFDPLHGEASPPLLSDSNGRQIVVPSPNFDVIADTTLPDGTTGTWTAPVYDTHAYRLLRLEWKFSSIVGPGPTNSMAVAMVDAAFGTGSYGAGGACQYNGNLQMATGPYGVIQAGPGVPAAGGSAMGNNGNAYLLAAWLPFASWVAFVTGNTTSYGVRFRLLGLP